MPDEEEPGGVGTGFRLLSEVMAQRGTADMSGNVVTSGDTTTAVAGDPFSEFILYGVFNGSFSAGPPQGASTVIDPLTNPMPYWTGPTSVSGGSIQCSWVYDAASPSTYNLRFDVAAGAAADEAYVEQIVPIGGSRSRMTGNRGRADFYRVTGTASFTVYTQGQYLTADGTTTGSETEGPVVAASDATVYSVSVIAGSPSAPPPADARFLRIRIGVRRTAAATTTATIDLCNVRQESARPIVLVADDEDPTEPLAAFFKTNGVAYIRASAASSTPTLEVDGTTGDIVARLSASDDHFRILGGHLRLDEIAAPSTPASGYLATYADTSGVLHTLNDAGADVALTALAPSTANYLVGTANAGLSAEIVVGTAPAGELGGTWASPTVDATHSGSAHSAYQPVDADLTAIAALTSAANKLPYSTGAQAWALADFVPGGTSFTPVLAYVTAGTSTWAPTVQVGSYTLVGDRCFYDLHYTGVPTNGTASGNLRLSGLPFTAQTLTDYAASGACAINGYTKAGYTMVVGSVISNVNTMLFRASGTAVAQAHLAVGDIPTGGSVDIRVSGSYVVA